jgi:hypothetical protein
MANTQNITRHTPQLTINLDDVQNRLRDLARTQACESCGPLTGSVIADITLLCSEIIRLHAALRRERLRSANFEAAIRAAFGAERDGEADPLAYLREEYPGYPDSAGGQQ